MAPLRSELAWLGSVCALLGGALAASSDCAEPLAVLTGGALTGALGVLLVAAACGVFALGAWIAARAPRRVSSHLLVAAMAACAALAPARTLFSGNGVRRTALGALGPWLVACAVAVGAWVLSAYLVPALRRGPRAPARLYSVLLFALVPVLVYLGRTSYPGLYRGSHTVVVALVCAVLLLGALPWVQRTLPRALATAVLALIALATATSSLAFGRQNQERRCLEGNSELGYIASYARDRVDLDGDGASPLFGGDDCADWDARVGPAAVEIAGDGRDADCDGRDAPESNATARARAYRTDPGMAARIREQARGRPTVVLLIDALRQDRVGPSDFPALATLARESLRFTRAFANSSSTRTSVAAMMTGRLQPPLATPSLAQRLRAAGKRSAIVGLRPVVDEIGEVYPVLRGFDPVLRVETKHRDKTVWGAGVNEQTSAEISRLVLELLDGGAPPDLIWAHYFDVHQWHALFPGARAQASTRYDAAVHAVDDALAALVARRDRINLVVLADHGESLGALDRLWHASYVGAEVVRVPWLMRVPGVAPATVSVPVGLSEVAPTLLDLLSVTLPPELEGRSALGLFGVAEPGQGPPIVALETREWSILSNGLRLRYAPHSRSHWLHDVIADPDERTDVSGRYPERAATLRAELLDTVHALERENGVLRYGYDE